MERKQFLIYATTATGLLPLLLTEIACDIYNDGGADTYDGPTFILVSTSNSGHTHRVTILHADVNAPPAGGKTISTSNTGGVYGHAHVLTLTQSDFQALGSGQTLTRTTSTEASHSHSFAITVPEGSSGNGGSDDNDPY